MCERERSWEWPRTANVGCLFAPFSCWVCRLISESESESEWERSERFCLLRAGRDVRCTYYLWTSLAFLVLFVFFVCEKEQCSCVCRLLIVGESLSGILNRNSALVVWGAYLKNLSWRFSEVFWSWSVWLGLHRRVLTYSAWVLEGVKSGCEAKESERNFEWDQRVDETIEVILARFCQQKGGRVRLSQHVKGFCWTEAEYYVGSHRGGRDVVDAVKDQ